MEIRRLILSVKRQYQWSRSFLTEVPALEVGNQGAIGHTCGASSHRKNYFYSICSPFRCHPFESMFSHTHGVALPAQH
jgi:hypothetical protein